MSHEDESQQPTAKHTACATRDERARDLGIGIGLLIAGSGMLARPLGWIRSETDLFLPAVFLGWAVYYLYRALGR